MVATAASIDDRVAKQIDEEQMSMWEKMINNIDKESKSELCDNVWLKRQVNRQ